MLEDKSPSSESTKISQSHVLTNLKRNLPPLFSRKHACETLGGLLSPRTLANLDSANSGPPRIKIGRKVVYSRDEFIRWLEARTSET